LRHQNPLFFMAWSSNEPDPLKARRLQLAEQERRLAEQMSRLNHELEHGSTPDPAAEPKPAEPPVWRMEEESPRRSAPESVSARRRNLARQRQRDRFVFFLCMALLLIVLGVVLWVWKTHMGPQG
jgi:hypothetical protein